MKRGNSPLTHAFVLLSTPIRCWGSPCSFKKIFLYSSLLIKLPLKKKSIQYQIGITYSVHPFFFLNLHGIKKSKRKCLPRMRQGRMRREEMQSLNRLGREDLETLINNMCSITRILIICFISLGQHFFSLSNALYTLLFNSYVCRVITVIGFHRFN